MQYTKPRSTTKVRFPSEKFGALALKVLESEVKTHEDRSKVVYTLEGTTLKVVITALSTRVLRLKVNAFYESCYLLASIFEKFPSYV